ncbi:MAG TPA: WD40 repeat domain-containing protein, partial [Planctomycetota bacterium]|nr:WD40 repeat domain-containing protein [Planctomycetota bacterium]
ASVSAKGGEVAARGSRWKVALAVVVAAAIAGTALALRATSTESPKVGDIAPPTSAASTGPSSPPDSGLDPVSREAAHEFLDSKKGAFHLEELWGSYARRCPNHPVKIAFSPDGSRVVIAGKDPAVIVYDAQSGRDLAILRGRPQSGLGVAWKDDRIAAACDDGNVYVWSTSSASGSATSVPISPAAVSGVDLSPDGRAIACSADGTVRAWHVATGAEIFSKRYGTPTTAVRFSRDGRLAAIADAEGTVRIWNFAERAEDGVPVSLPPDSWKDRTIQSVSFSLTDKRLLVSGRGSDRDSPIFVFDLARRQVERPLVGHGGYVDEVSCSPASAELAASVSNDGTVRLWNIATGACIAQGTPPETALGLDWSKDGRALATAGYDFAWWLWTVDRGTLGRVPPPDGGHVHLVRSVHFARGDGLRVVSGSYDHTAKLWRVGRRDPEATFVGPGVCAGAVMLPHDRGVFAAFELPPEARVWSLGEHGSERKVATDQDEIHSMSPSPDGSFAFTGGAHGDVVRWRLATGTPEVDHRYGPGDLNWVLGTSATSDGRTLLVGSTTLDLWDVVHGPLTPVTRTGGAFASVAFVGEHRALSGGRDNGAVLVWDLGTKEILETLDRHGSTAELVCVSPDGVHALSGGADGRICLWDLSKPEGQKLVDHVSLVSRADRPTSGDFAPDGRSFVIGTARGVILRYSIGTAGR